MGLKIAELPQAVSVSAAGGNSAFLLTAVNPNQNWALTAVRTKYSIHGGTKMKVTLVCALGVIALLLLPMVALAQAQQTCTEIRGVVQATLPTSYPLRPDTDVWGGPVFATFGGEMLVGGISGNDGGEFRHGGKGGEYQVYLCPTNLLPSNTTLPPACSDSFTYDVATSVFGFVPGKVGLGNYKGNTAKIVSGTGRFTGASGMLNVAGPYILFDDATSSWGISGRWNGEFSGQICLAK